MDLRVLLVSPLPPPYGGISHWTAMVKKYSESYKGVDLQVLDIAPRWRSVHDTLLWKRALGGGCQLLRDFLRFFVALIRFRPGVIHVTTPGQMALIRDILFLSVARMVGIKTVYHIRFGRVPDLLQSKKSLEARLFLLAARLARVVVAIDQKTHDSLLKIPFLEDAVLIPNCYDPSGLPIARDVDSKRIVFIGWVIPAKGVEELLRAWSSAREEGWTLLFVGPGDPDYIEELSEKSDRSVSFLGGVGHPKAMNILASSSILVLPSHTEGFPNVVLEGMALGKAVVATNVGAIPEMLDGGAGVLVPKQDSESLGIILKELMVNREKRESLGSVAFSQARKNYSLGSVFLKYCSIWRDKTVNYSEKREF